MVVRALAVLLPLTGLFLSTNGARAELYWSRDFDSAALGAKMKYSIYLPSGYHAPKQQKQRYPTVYLLHGVGDNERAWPSWRGVEATLDQMIASKALSPMIVVMPASKRSWYVDSADIGGPGNYATAVRDDLRAHIENAIAPAPIVVGGPSPVSPWVGSGRCGWLSSARRSTAPWGR
jgi:S-formylglutathione hydrolase FrmB